MTDSKQTKREFFDRLAQTRRSWKQRARAYHDSIADLMRFIVPRGKKVAEIGCATGELLAALEPSEGLGVDLSPAMVELAAKEFPKLEFLAADAENLPLDRKFDYVVMSDVIGSLDDVQKAFEETLKITTPRSRVVITFYNKLWYPVIASAEALGLKSPNPEQNWLTVGDVRNLLELAGFEVVKSGRRLLFPIEIPLITPLINKIIGNLPLFNNLCLVNYMVAKPLRRETNANHLSVSIIVPTMNESGNIEGAITRVAAMGTHVETIFVDGHSTDGTVEKIHEVIAKHPEKDIKFAFQDGKGKANAVFKGFDMATGDILMILDSDLTMPPEDLPKFYQAIAGGAGEFINGCRLVYPMEGQAMRTLNYFANHFFSLAFTWLLGQRLKDTLCGTKVLLRSDYEEIKRNRSFFGDFDPFGDFDLLFGAAKLNLKIVDMPIRYKDRVYGDIKIHRFRHGILLLQMCAFAARKIKFI
ncbi:MAG: glycosyltransferase [Candidatus Sumerlaeaceae bacterium]|nr:glycosyltransferase [Candidatus Sumerlaeaceae bacterium]